MDLGSPAQKLMPTLQMPQVREINPTPVGCLTLGIQTEKTSLAAVCEKFNSDFLPKHALEVWFNEELNCKGSPEQLIVLMYIQRCCSCVLDSSFTSPSRSEVSQAPHTLP